MGATNTDGYIAVWLGTFKDEAEFNEYRKVHYEYEDEIENIDSQFEMDFGLKYYDRDIVEFGFLNEDNNTLKTLFEGSSYLEKHIDSLDDNKLLQYNVIIRVYDYNYAGEKKCSKYKGCSLQFFQNIKYEKEVDLSWMGL